MDERFGGLNAGFTPAKALHHLMVLAIDFLSVLAPVGEQGLLLFLPYGGDVNVNARLESLGLRTGIDLIKIKMESPGCCVVGA